MNRSLQEEIILSLWVICALLSFGFGFTVWGCIFTIKSILDLIVTLKYVFKELKQEILDNAK